MILSSLMSAPPSQTEQIAAISHSGAAPISTAKRRLRDRGRAQLDRAATDGAEEYPRYTRAIRALHQSA